MRSQHNDISGDSVSIDYTMLRKALVLAYHTARCDIQHRLLEHDLWMDDRVTFINSPRSLVKDMKNLGELCELIEVVFALDKERHCDIIVDQRRKNVRVVNYPQEEE